MEEVGRDGRSVIRTEKADRQKGRGAAKPEAEAAEVDERYVGKSGMFDSLDDEPGAGPQRCKDCGAPHFTGLASYVTLSPSPPVWRRWGVGFGS